MDDLRDFSRRVIELSRTVRRAARRGRLHPSTMRKLRKILDDAVAEVEAVFEEEEGEADRD
jgi:hypothetical protein